LSSHHLLLGFHKLLWEFSYLSVCVSLISLTHWQVSLALEQHLAVLRLRFILHSATGFELTVLRLRFIAAGLELAVLRLRLVLHSATGFEFTVLRLRFILHSAAGFEFTVLRLRFVLHIATEFEFWSTHAIEKWKEKTTPFGINLMRSQVLYRAAQSIQIHKEPVTAVMQSPSASTGH